MFQTDRKPLLADGSIVGDYGPLFRYWEEARKRGLEEVSISASDLELVERRVRESGRLRLLEIRDELVARFLPRIDELAAAEAFRSLGIPLDPVDAKRRIAEILAGWALEAAKTLRIIELKGWLPDSRAGG